MSAIMVVLRDLQDVCKLLMSKINSTTPSSTTSDTSSSVRYRRNKLLQKRPPYFCDSTMRDSATNGSSNKHKPSVKISNSMGKQEHVLKILNSDKSPVKQTCFSPYTPLPAIGNNGETKWNTRPRIQRQLTYNVLEPVFVKGPIDFNGLEHKYITSTSNIKKSKPSEIRKIALNKKTELNKNMINKQSEDYETLEDRRKRMREEFSRKVHSNRIKINKDLIEATAKLKSEGKVNDKNAFWIEL